MKEKLLKIVATRTFRLTLYFLGLYLLSTGISLAVFSYLRREPAIDIGLGGGIEEARSKINLEVP